MAVETTAAGTVAVIFILPVVTVCHPRFCLSPPIFLILSLDFRPLSLSSTWQHGFRL